MSGIYGLLRFDGQPIDREALAKMRHAMDYYGPDGGGEWHEGPIGLGHLLLKVTPEDCFEDQPVINADLSLVAFARLDNREDLLREFGIPKPEQAFIPDSSLVLEAYSRWREECTDHLNGDWQFAAWDAQRKNLFIARDHHGNTGFYYFCNSRFVAFASSLKAILALSEVPRRPDMLKMAQVLTSWPGEGSRTAYERILRLPPAHTLSFAGSKAITKRYWFPENLPPLHLPNDQAYVDRFLDVYEKAVRTRLRSERPVGISLSGGLDSGSVAALAAPMLALAGKSLMAFTSVPKYETVGAGKHRTGNEWSMAAAVASMAGLNICHEPIKSENFGVIEGIERQHKLQDSPGHAASNQYWIADLLSQSRERGVGTLLTGQCGNGTISFAGNGQFIHPLVRGEFSSAVKTLLFAEPSLWLTLKRQILKPLLLPGISWYRRDCKGAAALWHEFSAINLDFAARIRLAKLMKEVHYDPTFTLPPNPKQQLAILDLGNNAIGARWHESGAGYGLEVRDPTIDRSVIEFCLQTPDDQFRRDNDRWLIRRAMTGKMPHEVIFYSKRGLQSADVGARVLSERESIMDALERCRQSALAREVLDISVLLSVLNSLERDVSDITTVKCSTILLRGLSVGLFLTQF
jgi:asparagine synthase (glutamine-hydrolysing)